MRRHPPEPKPEDHRSERVLERLEAVTDRLNSIADRIAALVPTEEKTDDPGGN